MKRLGVLIPILFAALLCIALIPAADAGARSSPSAGDFAIPLSARYVDNLGVGAGLMWTHRESGFAVLGQITWDQIDGETKTVLYDPDVALAPSLKHPPMPISVTIPSRSETGVTLTFCIPLKRPH